MNLIEITASEEQLPQLKDIAGLHLISPVEETATGGWRLAAYATDAAISSLEAIGFEPTIHLLADDIAAWREEIRSRNATSGPVA